MTPIEFFAVACVKVGVTLCPFVEVTAERPEWNGVPAVAMTICWPNKPNCLIRADRTQLYRTDRWGNWTVGETIVLHEMCHAKVAEGPKERSHGPRWKSCMKRLNVNFVEK